jgi:pyruvate formate lyase activating enzyme
VYLGNVGFQETNTQCPECGNILIKRTGYMIDITGVKSGKCLKCGYKIPIKGLE